MNVASLEVSKELYKLSGWQYDFATWIADNGFYKERILLKDMKRGRKDRDICPAYDLGYLLRRLPTRTYLLHVADYPEWYAGHDNTELSANTPEDAAALLAIELFKHGVLKKGEE